MGPDDALVLMTDLDEIPNGKTMNLLKHCELRDSIRFPMYLSLTVMPFNLRVGCPTDRPKYNKGTVSMWKDFKSGRKGTAGQLIWPRKMTTRVMDGGVHLTNYGSKPQIDYRLLNHGESGQIAPLVMASRESYRLCDIDSIEKINEIQQSLSDDPKDVLQRRGDKTKKHKPLKTI